jgi:hypothetical protein
MPASGAHSFAQFMCWFSCCEKDPHANIYYDLYGRPHIPAGHCFSIAPSGGGMVIVCLVL